MKSAFRTRNANNNGRMRRLLQCGTALPLLATAIPALAAPIQETSSGDITIEAVEATGTPVAVEVESTGGSVDVSVTTVTATAVAGDRDYVVGLGTGTDGSITGNFGSITATGEGELLGLGAESVGGAIDLTVGTVDVSGTATSGITAHSVDGSVSITADSVIARGTGFDSQGEFYEAVLGTSDNSSVSIDVGHAETYGTGGSAIGAVSGGQATIVADSAVAHAEGVIVAYAMAAGDASLDLGSVTLTAEDGQGVFVRSTGGKATLAVDTIETGALGEGARVLAVGDIDVTLGNVDAGGGLTATSNSGNVSVAVNGDIVGRTYGGMGLTGQNVSVTMAEGSSITVAGADGTGWNGIFASAQNSVDIVATEIATAGDNSHAINVQGGTGPVTIDSGSVSTTGAGAYGVNVNTAGGDVQIASDSVTTTGAGQVYGISAITNGGGIVIDSGTVDVASAGSDNGRGIYANSGGGDIVIDAGTSTGHTRAIFTTTLFEGGELGFTAGNTTITSESATATGGNAIIGQGYSVSLTSGRAEGTANPDFTAATIYVSAGAGGATVTAGDTLGHGYGQYGIQVLSTGDLQIASGSVATDGEFANGITAFGNSAIGVNSGTVATLGADSHGIYVDGYTEYGADPVSVLSETITTAGDRSNGIFVWSFNDSAGMTGDITLDSGSIETGGALSHGIVVASAADPGYSYRPVSAFAGTGALNVTSDTIVADGEGGRGIVFDHAGPITLASGSIAADAGGIYMWAGSTVDIVSESVVTRAGPGIVVYGAGDATLDAGTTHVGADGDTGIYVETTTGNISIVADETVTESLVPLYGFTADGILAVSSEGGNIALDSGIVSVKGEHAWGIGAATDGAVTIASDSVTTTGLGGVGIYARGSTGGVTLESGSVSTTGEAAHGIQAVSTTGALALNSTGAVTVSGNSANGIFANSDSGPISIAAANVAKSGGLGSAILADTTGTIDIVADQVTVTGPGADPGVRADGSGYRQEQGGIIVEGGEGAISIAAGSVAVEGEHRYGISARGNGAIDIVADDVTFASADSVAVVARGGAGDVSLTTGSVTTTGASGVGLFGNTTSGNVTIDAGTTRVENEGMAGQFTGDAVVGISGTGIVSIASAEAFSAALYGSAIYAQSGGDVSIVSGLAETTGNGGGAIIGQSGGDLSIVADAVTTSGADSAAVQGFAGAGTATIAVGDVTATGANAVGVMAVGSIADVTVDGTVATTGRAVLASGGTEAHVLVNGSVASTAGVGLVTISNHGVVEIAEGASVSGETAGVALLGSPQGGFTEFYNSGTVQGGTGAAVVGAPNTPGSPAASFYIQNNGTLVAGGDFAVTTGAGNDTLELTNLSQITGIADLGAGDDRLVLDLNDDAPEGALGQVVSTVNVEGLSVDSGAWRAEGAQSVYGFVEIEEGATLTVAENADGDVAVATPLVELGGRLNLELVTNTEPGDLTGVLFEGAGSLHLTGTATVLVDDASGLQHTGGTFVENGELLLTTVYGGDVATSGEGVFELGENGDFTGNLVNDGTFVFSQAGDYGFLGDFTGTGQLDKNGEGTLTFAGLYGFEGTTSVFGGTVAFTGQLAEDTELDLTEGTIDLSQVEGGEQTIASLSGEGGTLQLGDSALIIEQFGDTVFAGSITGMGELIMDGEGELDLTGDGTGFTGTGQVDGGTLSVNGDFSNADFVVNEGGTLGGAGTIGDTEVTGGTLAPGNSIGTLTVDGDVAFTAASVFEVEVDPAGNSDLLQATGTATLGGAAVDVIAESGIYRPFTDYTILTADGGVSGTFGSVDVNLAFLDPTLVYSANAVTLRLTRNNIDFAAYGETPNQAAIGGLIESLGYGNVLYDATLTLVDTDVVPSFASLTGEVYPGYAAGVIETAEMLRRQTTGSMAAEGSYAWAAGLHTDVESGNGGGKVELVGKGVAGGFGFGGNGFSASVGLGLLDHDNGAGDFAGGETTFAIGQLAYTGLGGLAISAGAQFGWVDGDFRRQTSLGTVGGAVTGSAEGDYLQLFGELAYSLPMGAVSVEPFAGISHVAVEFDNFAESGEPTALAVSGIDRDVTFGNIGLRVSGDAGSGVRPYASAAYRHAWGDRASPATVGFAGTTGTVLIAGAPIAQDAAELSAGVAVTRGNVDFEVGYDGTVSNSFDSHGVSAALRFRF